MTARPTAEQVAEKSARNRASWAGKAASRKAAHSGRVVVAEPAAASRQRNHGKPDWASDAIRDPHVRLLALHVAGCDLPTPKLEYQFAAPRKWRADLAWPDRMLIVEIDGTVHRIKARFKADLLRDQAIFLLGWRKLRVSPAQVRDGTAIQLVKRALASPD